MENKGEQSTGERWNKNRGTEGKKIAEKKDSGKMGKSSGNGLANALVSYVATAAAAAEFHANNTYSDIIK